MQEWIRNNSLSLVFFVLFIISLAGQSISGLYAYNQLAATYNKPDINYFQYLKTGTFLDGVFVNWQAALLQLGSLILMGAVLHQKGAAHSRKPENDSKEKRSEQSRGWPWIYRNSLSLAMGAIFAISFIGHIIFGTSAQNESLSLIDQPPVSVRDYIFSGSFWFKTLQAWEAEFIAIFIFLILSIFLRQQGSAESKPLTASDQETGEANK